MSRSSKARKLCVGSLLVAGMLLSASTARAEAFLRIISNEAPIHTGPSERYRHIHTAKRGEVFEVLERGNHSYWFRVMLDDGTTGWVFGEQAYPYEHGDSEPSGLFARMGGSISDAILAPSPVPSASVELSISSGVLDGEGTFLFRPAWLIDPYFAIEGFAGLSPRQQEDLFLGGAGWTLRMLPGAPIGPFIHGGVGVSHLRPKADNFTQKAQTLFAMVAGGGLEITLKKQITLRFDFRNWTIFDPNQASNGQEYSGGLAIFF